MTNKIKVLFFLYKNKLNKQNKAPIYCRLTLNKKRRHFSTGYFIPVIDWNVTTHSVYNSNILANSINTKLSIIERKIMDITLKYEVNDREYTLDEIWNEVNGKTKDNVKSLLQAFDMHNDNMELLVGKSHSIATVKKFKSIRKQLKEFILFQYKQDDIILSNIKMKFLTDFEYYMLTEKDMKQISINKTIQRMRKIIKFSIAHEYLDKDPFLLYKAKSVKIEVVYLSPEELKKLEQYDFDSRRLEKVRDCFVFCCYTGLPYAEMANLRAKHIITGVDRKKWIKMQRQKTDKPLLIPLLQLPKKLLKKYAITDENSPLLPIISNQKFNSYLKEISEILDIKKKLSHHVARKTFASTVLLYNDVPMEIVSELLGHSDIKVTQKHYAKVANKKVGSQMEKLSKKLNNRE